jgi:voltage-gated potassium channel
VTKRTTTPGRRKGKPTYGKYVVVDRIRKIQRILGPAVWAAFIVLGILYAATVVAVYLGEHGHNPRFDNFGSALFWVFVRLLAGAPWGVTTAVGMVTDYFLGLLKPISIAVLTAALTTQLFDLIVKRSSGMGRSRAKEHIVICGWSSKGSEIIREIRGRGEEEKRIPIVVLAPLKGSPSKDEYTNFIAGDPTSSTDLKRAGIERADVAIVLADNSYPDIDAEDMDSRTLLTTLAIESLNPKCYTCVEVVQSANREHFSRTKADELVVSAHMTGALLAHSAMAPGLSRILDDLLTFPQGDEFYWIEVPPSWDGRDFVVAMTELKTAHDCVPIAVSRDGNYTTNPPADYRLAKSDRILVLSKTEPLVE